MFAFVAVGGIGDGDAYGWWYGFALFDGGCREVASSGFVQCVTQLYPVGPSAGGAVVGFKSFEGFACYVLVVVGDECDPFGADIRVSRPGWWCRS